MRFLFPFRQLNDPELLALAFAVFLMLLFYALFEIIDFYERRPLRIVFVERPQKEKPPEQTGGSPSSD